MCDVTLKNLKNSVKVFFEHIKDPGLFNERQIRICSGLFAMYMGENGISYVNEISGIDTHTIKRGITEIKSGQIVREDKRIREIGGGRTPLIEANPELLNVVQEIIDESTYGSPEGKCSYKNLSLNSIVKELEELGYSVTKNTVGKFVEKLDYSKQQNQKLLQVGDPHPQRDEILDNLFATKREYEAKNLPCLSVDTKNKITIGNYKNAGQEYLPARCPRLVLDHDFPQEGKIIPYGGYIPSLNCGMIVLNESSDTAQLAVSSLRIFYEKMVTPNFEDASEILVLCDSGGSNGRRVRLFKYELALMAEELGITIHVCHFPPGESKYNQIEHKMFNHISRNWAAKPITDVTVAQNYIKNTTTSQGLTIECEIDQTTYEKGIKISDEDFENIEIQYVGPVPGFSYKISGLKNSEKICNS